METGLKLIQEYQEQYSGMSSYLDNQLGTIQHLLHESHCREKEKEYYWCEINLLLADSIAQNLLEMVVREKTVPGHVFQAAKNGVVKIALEGVTKYISNKLWCVKYRNKENFKLIEYTANEEAHC